MKRIIAATLIVLLTGCAVPYVEPRQLTKEESKGLAECKYEAVKATAGRGDSSKSLSQMMHETVEQAKIIESCLEAKGLDPLIAR